MNAQPVSQIPFKGDWGRCPNKQICEDCTEWEIEKMSEPVQVYTACQFLLTTYNKNDLTVDFTKVSQYKLLTSAFVQQKMLSSF